MRDVRKLQAVGFLMAIFLLVVVIGFLFSSSSRKITGNIGPEDVAAANEPSNNPSLTIRAIEEQQEGSIEFAEDGNIAFADEVDPFESAAGAPEVLHSASSDDVLRALIALLRADNVFSRADAVTRVDILLAEDTSPMGEAWHDAQRDMSMDEVNPEDIWPVLMAAIDEGDTPHHRVLQDVVRASEGSVVARSRRIDAVEEAIPHLPYESAHVFRVKSAWDHYVVDCRMVCDDARSNIIDVVAEILPA